MRKAIVMAGGQGSRLWPLTFSRPKPLVPIANRPVMAYILEWLRRHGVSDVLVTLHYRADHIRRAFGDGHSFDLSLSYRVEEAPLGTAGSVRAAADWIGNEPFLIVSGDVLTDLDLEALCRQHHETGSWLTLGVKPVADPSEYGIVALDDQRRVARFQEKPAREQAWSHLANTGIYAVAPQALAHVPQGGPSDWSRNIFPRFLAERLPLFGCVLEGYWCDIGSVGPYRAAQRDALEGTVRASLPGIALGPGVRVGNGSRLAPGTVIKGPALLGAGCRIEAGARILPGSVLGDGATVHAEARISGATIEAGCEVGAGSVLQDCVLDEEVSVGEACRIGEGAVIGRGCRLAAGVCVKAGRRLAPGEALNRPPPSAIRHPRSARRTAYRGTTRVVCAGRCERSHHE
jgi:mannose-1-phosphate guanylyltransferase/phosphomannomutase